jgi:GT2 family glycosyltransferase
MDAVRARDARAVASLLRRLLQKLAWKASPVAWVGASAGFSFKLLELADSREEDLTRVNAEVAAADQDWLVVVRSASDLISDAMAFFAAALRSRPDADIAYADEAYSLQAGCIVSPYLKPEFDPELLLAYNYISFPVLMKRKVFLELGGFRASFGRGADHDLWLRAYAAGCTFVRVDKILLRAVRRRSTTGGHEQTLAVVSAFCREARPELSAMHGLVPSTVRVQRRFSEHPVVTLLVPTCQGAGPAAESEGHGAPEPHIRGLLRSLQGSTWPMQRLRVLVADDCEDDAVYAGDWPFTLRRIVTRRATGERFNYARKMNSALAEIETEAVVLMNDDVQVKSPDWLEAMLTFSLDEEVGGVGARLLFPDGRLQHAGVVGGLLGTAAHAWYGEPATAATYGEWARVHKNWSMVTGAVFATRKSVLDRVGGFDEGFALEFNDLDLCLRLRLLGYRIVYTPFAELLHYERASRGPGDTPAHELAKFRRRWRDVLASDPASHPGFSQSSYVLRPAP